MDDYVDTEVTVDDAVIDGGNVWKVVVPIWWSVSIYDGPEKYNADLRLSPCHSGICLPSSGTRLK
jgi:hypothetical protein